MSYRNLQILQLGYIIYQYQYAVNVIPKTGSPDRTNGCYMLQKVIIESYTSCILTVIFPCSYIIQLGKKQT